MNLEQIRELVALQHSVERAKANRSILSFIPYVSQRFEPPEHLRPFTEALESALHGEQRLVISTPPQHAKTETVLHGLSWLMDRAAGKRNAYVSYEATRAETMSLRGQAIALEAGLVPEGTRRMWRTRNGSTMMATGIGGPLTGYAIDGVLVVDDPVKDRVTAESATYRDRTHDWFRDVAMTRIHPGASVIVIQTRWHHDDLAGRLIKDGWAFLNLPAINLDGGALWESQRPLAWLEEKRKLVGPYTWASLYQGEPRPRGGRVFEDAYTYDKLPASMRYYVGVDFAYSTKTYSDYSVAVVQGYSEGKHYILDVVRKQVDAPAFAQNLSAIKRRYPTAKFIAHVSGVEKGIVDLVKMQSGVAIRAETAREDKFTRAQPVAAAWNQGKVLVPANAPWASALVEELSNFTGIDDPHDDQVDALASSFTDFASPPPARGMGQTPILPF